MEEIITISKKYHTLPFKRKKALLELLKKWVLEELVKLEDKNN